MNNQELIAHIKNYLNSVDNGSTMFVPTEIFPKMARIALAALTAEPVAWEVKGILCHTKEDADKYVGTPVPLIESLIDNTAQQYEALAGWKMVPVEPSKEMRSQIHPIADGNCSHCGNRTTLDCEENMLLSWRDMLEAAPKPEA